MTNEELLKLIKKDIISKQHELELNTLQPGDLTQLYKKTKDYRIVERALQYESSMINDKYNESSLIELLVQEGYTSVLNKYAKYIDLNMELIDKKNVFTFLIKKEQSTLLYNVLEYSPNKINVADATGTYALELLINKGYTTILNKFARHVDPTIPMSNGTNLLSYTIQKDLSSTISNILTYHPEEINTASANGIYPVEYLANKGYSTVISNFAKYVNLDLPASNGKTLGGYLCQKDYYNSLKDVLNYTPESINTKDKNNVYLVEHLVDKGYTSVMESFAKYIDLTLPATNGKTLLGYMVSKGYYNTAKVVLAYCPDSINVPGTDKVYPVEYIADKGYSNILSSFPRAIDLSLPASNGKNLLGYLIQKELSSSIKEILTAQPESINVPGNNGVYPVEYLADKGYGTIMTSFAKYIDLNQASSNGKTLAGYLAQKGHNDVLREVFTYHPDSINSVGPNNIHTVEYIVSKGYKSLITSFAKYIDSSFVLSNGKTIKEHVKNKMSFDLLENNYPITKVQYNPNIVQNVNQNDEESTYVEEPIDPLSEIEKSMTTQKKSVAEQPTEQSTIEQSTFSQRIRARL